MSDKQIKQLHYTSEEIADMLDDTNWSREFSWEQIKCMSQYFKIYGIEQKQVIFRQGDADNSMGILLKGTLKIIRMVDDKKKLLATVRAPQTFGELALIDGQPRSAYVVAASDAEYILITKECMDKLAKEHSQVAYHLLWKISYILSQRFRNTTGQLAEVMESGE